MKIALWIEDGREQIVLTGETDIEKNLLRNFKDKSVISIHEGSFYGCRGGWTRHAEYYLGQSKEIDSLILVIDQQREPAVCEVKPPTR